jgi:hypothetical protein
VDLSSLRDKITDKFDILGLKLSNKLISSMDQEIDFDNDLSVEDLEKEIFLGTLDLEKRFKSNKSDILDIFQTLKSQLSGKKNYKKIKKQLESWILSKDDLLKLFLAEIKLSTTIEKKELKISSKNKKKEKKDSRTLEEEPDLSDIDYSELLEDGDIDNLIDDEDLDL